MKVFQQDIEELKPYEFNNRTHPESQVQMIASSIEEFGFNQPLVIDEDKNIIVGHGRWLAGKMLHLEEVPCVQIDSLTEEQIRAYRIIDNKLQNDSSWMFNNLELELGWLEDNEFELEKYGLDDLQDLFPEQEPEISEDDFEAEEPEETYIKLGDLIELGRHRVLCGDSCNAESYQELLEGKKADMVFTDPPYGIDYQSKWRIKTPKFHTLKNDNEILTEWIPFIGKHSLGFVYIWTTWKVLKEWLEATKELGEITNLLVWDKGGGGIGDLKKTFSTDYEIALVWHRGSELTGKRLGSVWSIGKDSQSSYDHPTQKPIGLAATAIKSTSKAGHIVLDSFLGSGSTLIACEQLNRTCYGIEIEPKYCQVIIERYKKYCTDNDKPFECKINGEAFDG